MFIVIGYLGPGYHGYQGYMKAYSRTEVKYIRPGFLVPEHTTRPVHVQIQVYNRNPAVACVLYNFSNPRFIEYSLEQTKVTNLPIPPGMLLS